MGTRESNNLNRKKQTKKNPVEQKMNKNILSDIYLQYMG